MEKTNEKYKAYIQILKEELASSSFVQLVGF